MKIAVLGAGAMGGIVAIGLHRGGHDPLVIDPWKPHVEAIRTTGFHMTGYYGQQPVDWQGTIPPFIPMSSTGSRAHSMWCSSP